MADVNETTTDRSKIPGEPVKVDYLKIVGGKFAKTVPEGTEGAVERINQRGAKVFEVLFKAIRGFILSIEIKTKEDKEGKPLGMFLIIKTVFSGQKNNIEINADSGYASDFLDRFANINIAQECEIQPMQIKKEGSEKYGYYLVPYQANSDGERTKIEKFFTKDNPGAPMGVQVNKGTAKKPVMEWDFSAALSWYATYVENTVQPKLQKNKAMIALHSAE